MFDSFLRRLLAPSPSALPAPDAELAFAALLVRLAKADADYSQPEALRIEKVLRHYYQLSPEGAQELRNRAEQLEAEAPDTVRFTRALKEATLPEERTGLIEAMWSVALADADRDAGEDSLMRLITGLLGVSDLESGLARQRAQSKMLGTDPTTP